MGLRASTVLFLILTGLAAGSGRARALDLSYGGRLTDASGAPLAGPVDLTVRFYRAASGGGPVGPTLTLKRTALSNGVFQVPLTLAPADVATLFGDGTESVFVEVSAAGKTYARQRFSAVPYALRVPVDGQTVGYDDAGHLTLLSTPAAGQAVLSSLGSATAGAAAGNLLGYDGTRWTATPLPPPPTLGGDLTGSLGAASVAKIQGQTVVATGASNGDFLKWDGSQWAPGSVSGAAGGTVTSVATTTPLTLTGNATTAPTLGIAPATAASDGYLSAADWGAFNGKQAAITSTTTINAGTVTSAKQDGLELKPYGAGAAQTGELRFDALSGPNFVGLKAPDTISASKVWILPAADGSAGQLLKTDGSGNLGWVSGATPTGAAGGDLGGTYPNPTVQSVSGTIPVAHGGTGVTSFTTNGVLLGGATVSAMAPLTDGQLLVGSSGSAPQAATLAQGTTQGVTIANGHGTITLDTAQDIRPTAAPTFAGLTDTALAPGSLVKAAAGSSLAAATAADVTSLLAGTYVARGGDTMTGALALPSDGLTVGSGQLTASGGKVGIGALTPSELLQIGGTAGATGRATIGWANGGWAVPSNPTANSDGDKLVFYKTAGYKTAIGMQPDDSIFFQNSGSGGFRFWTGGVSAAPTEVASLTQSGRFGLGVTTPVALLQTSQATAPTGTGVATSYLHLGGNEFGANSYRLLTFGWVNGSSVNPPAYLGYQETAASASTSGDLVFGTRNVTTDTAPSERLRITGAGLVGIGSATPQATLDVNGTVRATAFLSPDGAANWSNASLDNIQSLSIGTTAVGTDLFFGNGTPRTISVQTSSLAGQTLTVQAGGTSGTGQNGGNLILASGTANGSGTSQIQLQTANGGAPVTAMTIFGSGSVGVGTTSASGKVTIASQLDSVGPDTLTLYNTNEFGGSQVYNYITATGNAGVTRFSVTGAGHTYLSGYLDVGGSGLIAGGSDMSAMRVQGTLYAGGIPTYGLIVKPTGVNQAFASQTAIGGVMAGATGNQATMALSGSNTSTSSASNYGVYSSATGAGAGTNVGGYFTASGASGANYALLTGGGNVGIGTPSPATALDVVGNLTIGGASARRIILEPGSDVGSVLDFDGSPTLATGGVTMRMFRFTNSTGGGSFEVHSANGTNSPKHRLASSGNGYLANGGGKIGVGTTAPSTTLEVSGSASGTGISSSANHLFAVTNADTTGGNWTLLGFGDATGTAGGYGGGLGFQMTDHTNHYGDFAVATRSAGGYTEKLRVTSAGNVGIGTSSPLVKMHVKVGTDQNFWVRSLGGYTQIEAANDAGTTDVPLRLETSQLLIDSVSGGFVGIGVTSPGAPLDVYASVRSRDYFESNTGFYTNAYAGAGKYRSAGRAWGVIGRVDDDRFRISYGGNGAAADGAIPWSDVLSILGPSGNVGIGSVNPGAKLDVVGTVKITDGSQGAGKILASDAAGLAGWVTRSNIVTASGASSGTMVCVGNGAWALNPFNNTVTITTTGKPVQVTAQARQYKSGTCGRGYMTLRVDGTVKTDPSGMGMGGSYECNATGILSGLLNLSAGTHTIELMVMADSGNSICSFGTFDYLMAQELL